MAGTDVSAFFISGTLENCTAHVDRNMRKLDLIRWRRQTFPQL